MRREEVAAERRRLEETLAAERAAVQKLGQKMEEQLASQEKEGVTKRQELEKRLQKAEKQLRSPPKPPAHRRELASAISGAGSAISRLASPQQANKGTTTLTLGLGGPPHLPAPRTDAHAPGTRATA